MPKLPAKRLDAMVEEALVDAYGEEEQRTAFHTVLGDRLTFPSPPRCWASRWWSKTSTCAQVAE